MSILKRFESTSIRRKESNISPLKVLLTIAFLATVCLMLVGGMFTIFPKARAAASDGFVAQPTWWSGNCDVNNNPGSYSMYSFRGVEACNGGTGHVVNIGGFSMHEWECAELAFRYLKVVYGINPYSLPNEAAKYIVSSFPTNGYPNNQFQKFTNNTSQAQHNAPQPGDIISYDNPNSLSDAGHVAIVTASNVDPGTGNGSITIMQQNADGHYGGDQQKNETVQGWIVQNLYSNRRALDWLHDPTGNTPAVVKNRNGELEAFARTNDGFIKHIWQQCAGCGWLSDWVGLSGGTMQRFTSNPAVANNAGLLEVFAIGIDHNLWHTWEQSDGSWVNWQQFSGGTILVGDPVVTLNQDGRMEVFVRQDNGTLWDTSKKCPGSCGWNSWYDLTSSGLATHYSIADDPTVTLTSDGRLELFARTADNSQNVFYVAQTTPGGSWGFWRSLGGYALGKQWVVKNYQGELEVFARASDSSIWHNWENTPGAGANGRDPGSNWHGWTQLASGYANNPMVAVNANGEMEVFVRGADQHIYHDYQVSPGGSWSGWQSLIGGTYNFFGDPIVAMNNDGRLELFARGITNQMYHDWQNSSSNGPTSWSPFAGGNLYTLGTVQFR